MANYSKLKVIWRNNLNNIYKENTIIGVGQEAVINMDENGISNIYVNFKVNDDFFTDLVEINGNVIQVPFKTDVLKEGTHQLEIVAYLKNGDVVPSPTFSYYVEKSLENTDDIIADTHYPILIELLEKVEEWNERVVYQEEQRMANENERKSNEINRQSNENTRISNEDTRQSNESSRQQYETQRRVEEDERLTDEQVRVNAENIRIANENERLRKEIERQNAEELRQISYNSSLYGRMDEVENQNEGIVSVKSFGAKGDGVTDDTESFKKAIYDSPNGTTIIIPSGTYLVSNVNKYQSKKNITIKGYGNPTIKLKHTYTPTHLGEYTGNYTVKSYYEEVDFGDKCTVATVTLENGLNYYYFKISDSTIIPAWLTAGSTIKGKNSNVEAYISNIDKDNPDGEGTARIYLYETINYNKGRLNFSTSNSVLTEPILRTPQLNSSRYVIEFEDGTIPSYITTDVKITQLSNGKSCRVQGTTTIDNKKYLVVDSFNTNAIFYETERNPLDDNLAFKVEKCSVGSASFITLNKWENVVIEGITFDGANYEVAQKESNANGWNIIYTGACNNLTIRDCSFINSIMAGLQITGISNSYSPAKHDFVSNVLVDNCTFFNNGRGDIEIIQGDTINITNCEGDGYLDIECNNNEILNNVNISFCNFRYTTPYSPGASNSSTSINYMGCKFQLFENQDGLTTFLTNCKIYQLAVYNAYCNLNGCTVNTLSVGNNYNGNEKLHVSNSYILGWYTTNPASKNGNEKMVFDNVVIDLSIAPSTLNMLKRNLIWSNVRMLSSIKFKTINCTNMNNSIFANCTFKNFKFFEQRSSAGNIYNNCRFLLLDKTKQVPMFSGNSGGTFNNCYFEATMNSTYGGSTINDCILSYEAKPMFSGYNGLKINGVKDDQNKGIDWYWVYTSGNTEANILRFYNVWLSKNVPGNLGIKAGYYALGTTTVLKNSSVFWTDRDDRFMTKIIYTEDNTLGWSSL